MLRGELRVKNNKMNRRNFIKTAVSSGILIASGNLLIGCGSNSNTGMDNSIKNDRIDDLEVDYLRQMITSDPSTSRCIMFQSDDILMKPIVEIKSDDSEEIKTFNTNEQFFTDDDHVNNQYSAQIEGLEVGKNYQYRIVDSDHCSQWHEIRTTNGNHYKALIFPDSQCADYNVWKNVAQSAYERNQDVEFFVNIGDLVDNGEDWTQWRSWFHGADNFLDKIICVPMIGNHECYSRQWEVRQPLAYLNYFELPKNGSKKYERRYYSFDFGDTHFAVLDSQWDELESISNDGDDLIREQKDWLRRDLKSSEKKWKIVMTHKDVLQYRINGRPERREGFSDIGTEFMPMFDELGVDVVFTGHLHTYRNRGHIYNFEHNSQGPLYILTGIAGDVRYPGLWIDHALDIAKAPQPEIDNYLTLEVNDDKLEIKCFLADGTEIDNAEVTKSNLLRS